MSVLMILGGMAILIAGGELLVRGASAIAKRAGMSSALVGVTVVAMATSAPEFAVSLSALFSGQAELVIGNVAGSNIANVLLVLGLGAMVAPLLAEGQILRIDAPLMVGASLLLVALAWDGTLGRLDALALIALVVGHQWLCVRAVRLGDPLARSTRGHTPEGKFATGSALAASSGVVVGAAASPADGDAAGGERDDDTSDATPVLDAPEVNQDSLAPAAPTTEPDPDAPARPVVAGALVITGVALLVLGSRLLVDGAVDIATALGVSPLIVGLTVVAIGTSLPEIVTTVIALLKGETGLAIGNAVGSNLFNIGFVLGVPALVAGDVAVPGAAQRFDLPVAAAAAALLMALVLTGKRLSRFEGGLLFTTYIAYLVVTVLATQDGASLMEDAETAMWVVLPAALAILTWAAWRTRHWLSPTRLWARLSARLRDRSAN